MICHINSYQRGWTNNVIARLHIIIITDDIIITRVQDIMRFILFNLRQIKLKPILPMKKPKIGQPATEIKYTRLLRKLAAEELSPYLFTKNFLGGRDWEVNSNKYPAHYNKLGNILKPSLHIYQMGRKHWNSEGAYQHAHKLRRSSHATCSLQRGSGCRKFWDLRCSEVHSEPLVWDT